MNSTTWASETMRTVDRLAYWREIVCRTILNVSPESEAPPHFQARIAARNYGAFKVAQFHSQRHRILRRPQHIRREDEPTYLVSLQVEGQSLIAQDETRFTLDPGEIAIMDSRRPFEMRFEAPVQRLIAIVPSSVLEPRIPWLKRSRTLKIDARAPYLDMTRQHIRQLVGSDTLPSIEANLLVENLYNLLALSTRAEETGRPDQDVQLENILAFCRSNLFDPRLSPAFVARGFGISLRTLHMRFEKTGQSFGDWIVERRLETCREALSDPRQGNQNISQIAYRAGFNDLSHFCRLFKRRFGVSASAWRNRPN
ncbi:MULTISPECIES: helix-turn-helix domain-containing protein [unclassified Beijerinckia]|uniref:helix-turn-helix domain-containing protein n=1 Tax=unclassified Beijerinckia TaxID=2638183 RepID=UPI0008989F45|nr:MULTISPECIES: helix-turn-helix domain-containing protein [unclassified Beijerinckia]MDH7799647.1 AraC family transcriptional activator of tynA and feaB [Beijerinckia sp. GAS462]SEB48580.1 AraC-type DNA-binding protein [Beijerinckia sp. 28-YEA-48]